MGTMTESRRIKVVKDTSVCRVCRKPSVWGVCSACQKKLGYL
jgi:hypothetical protein